MPSLRDMRGQAKEAGLMKLDRLIAARQRVPDGPLRIPLPELCSDKRNMHLHMLLRLLNLKEIPS